MTTHDGCGCSDPGSEFCHCHYRAGHREGERIMAAAEARDTAAVVARIARLGIAREVADA